MSANRAKQPSSARQVSTQNEPKSTWTPSFSTEMDYFQRERTSLETSTKRELSKNEKPEKKAYFPYVYNSLEPYGDLTVYSKALDAPSKPPQYQYQSRNTALGLKTPMTSHSMDTNLSYFDESRKRNRERRQALQEMHQRLENDDARSTSPSTCRSGLSVSSERTKNDGNSETHGQESAKGKRGKQGQQKSQATSSTAAGETTNRSRSSEKAKGNNDENERFPLFPTVIAVPNELSGKDLNYSHVPRLREELNNTYSMNATRKIDQQYRLTKHEFHQRLLDRAKEYHPDSWPTMRQTYFAYLQNNPGSARAVSECVKKLDDELEERQQQQQKTARNERQEPPAEGQRSHEDGEEDRGAAPKNRLEIIQDTQCKLNLIGGRYD